MPTLTNKPAYPCAFIASEISFLNISCLSSFSMSNSCCSLVRFMNCKKSIKIWHSWMATSIPPSLKNKMVLLIALDYLSLPIIHFFRPLAFLFRRRRRFLFPPSLSSSCCSTAFAISCADRLRDFFFSLNISHGWLGKAHLRRQLGVI